MTTSTFNRAAIVLGVAGIIVGVLIRTGNQGAPVAGSSGKYGWCWKLAEPLWTWDGLTEIRPRTLRMEFA